MSQLPHSSPWSLLLLLPLLLRTCLPLPVTTCPSSCTCRAGVVNCSSLQLAQIPDGLPDNMTTLDLSHNRLRDSSWNELSALASDQHNLQQLILTDNILTTIPESGIATVTLELSDNPIHCDCRLLALPPSQFVNSDKSRVICSTTSNPEIQNVNLNSLTPLQLRCDEMELSVPAEITLYKIGYDQVIPCHKSKPGTVIWYRKGEIRYRTSKQDCSLLLRHMTSKEVGLYRVTYEAPLENKTVYINVLLKKESSQPRIDDSNSLVEVQRKGTAKLTCKSSGAPPPSVEWFYQNISVSNIQDDKIVIVDKETLIVTDVTREEVFTCRATNVLGTTEAKFVVKTIDRIRGAVFEWLAPLSVALLIVTGAGSIGYIFYSKQKLARLKQRCSSPGVSDTGTIFENCEALPSTITQCEGYKMLAVSTSSPPNQLICPITRECMKNPVVASDGFSYEEKAILAWFKRNGTSPMTNGEISKRLIQNHNLRTLIRDIMDKTSMSDSFLNLDHLSPPSTARGSASNHHTRGKVVTSPSLSRLSRVAPEDTIIESSSSQPSTSRSLEPNSGASPRASGVNVASSRRSSVNNRGQSASTESGSSGSRTSTEHQVSGSGSTSGVNPAAELSNVSTRDHRLRSNSSTNSRLSTDQGIGASVAGSVTQSEPLRESSDAHTFDIEISEDAELVTNDNEPAARLEVHGIEQNDVESSVDV